MLATAGFTAARRPGTRRTVWGTLELWRAHGCVVIVRRSRPPRLIPGPHALRGQHAEGRAF
jgi:hypothetical protein